MEGSPVGGVRGKEGLVVSKLCGVNATIIIFVFVVTSGHTLFHLMRFCLNRLHLRLNSLFQEKFMFRNRLGIFKLFRIFKIQTKIKIIFRLKIILKIILNSKF